MSSGSHAGFMGGAARGRPSSGDPRHRGGCLRVDLEGPAAPNPGVWASRAPAGEGEREGKGGSGLWGSPGVRSVGTDMPERLLLASGLPRAILESNCLLIPSGCN